jgi:hypothetical protein
LSRVMSWLHVERNFNLGLSDSKMHFFHYTMLLFLVLMSDDIVQCLLEWA